MLGLFLIWLKCHNRAIYCRGHSANKTSNIENMWHLIKTIRFIPMQVERPRFTEIQVQFFGAEKQLFAAIIRHGTVCCAFHLLLLLLLFSLCFLAWAWIRQGRRKEEAAFSSISLSFFFFLPLHGAFATHSHRCWAGVSRAGQRGAQPTFLSFQKYVHTYTVLTVYIMYIALPMLSFLIMSLPSSPGLVF